MAKTVAISAGAEPDLKADGEAVLTELGLTGTQATTLFNREIVREQGIPFPLRRPESAPGHNG
ncbi:MAG TPA: type II toxin-antitoxin system RelB/DinJ family antitoxin [Longimicrobiaceae bacterium]|nr:type II toxin-antitoxin system RelB/DinJ family antitoxin [Longimicrobiaceae bacterium]